MNSHIISYASGLVGQYYQTKGNTKLAIWLAGNPSIPNPAPDDAKVFANAGFDLARPDYYGQARSGGFFSPKGCIQTAYDTIQVFSEQGTVLSIYENEEVLVPVYDEIVIIGASYGGRISAILPKFDQKIKEVVLLFPRFAADDADMLGYPEESNEESIRQYSLQKGLYRFAEGTDPYEAMLEIGEFDSTQDSSHLQDTKVFVGHGSADDAVWCGRSKAFVEQLKEMNPDGKYHYAEYYGLGHGGTCKEAALKGRLHRRKQFEKNEQ